MSKDAADSGGRNMTRRKLTGRTFRRVLPELQRTVLNWYAEHARPLWWRTRQNNAYIVLLSEMMLQQTQTARVEEKLPLFLDQFPTIHELAKADNATIIRAWQGMGYNNRAIRLRDCARAIVSQHGGVVPHTMEALLALPGIGKYTASAILAFAYGKDVPVVDINILRVYSRLFWKMPTTASQQSEKEIHEYAANAFPSGTSSAWHQAIMDISAFYCTARVAKCISCPVREFCASADSMKQEVSAPKKAEPSFRGIPNRIWRGRVIEFLRRLEHHTSIARTALLMELLPDSLFDEGNLHALEWFNHLLAGLARDRLVSVTASPAGADEVYICLYQEDREHR